MRILIIRTDRLGDVVLTLPMATAIKKTIPNARVTFLIDAYTRQLEDKLVAVIGNALGDLRPARLSFGHSEAGFAKNRRTEFSPYGPVDHDVLALHVDDGAGRMRAVVFGYACHNTTMPAEVCQLNGDYAGF